MLAAAALGAAAPAAHAGSYTVVRVRDATTTGRGTASRASGISADECCPGSTTMGNAVAAGARIPLGATGTTTFTAPSGMTIADFVLTRQLTYRNGAPADGTRRLYAIYKLGGTVVRRRRPLRERDAQPPQRRRLLVRLSGEQRRRADGARSRARASPRSRATPAPPPRCRSRSAASTAASTPPCTVAPGGGIAHLLSGAQVVLNDPTAPAASSRPRACSPAARAPAPTPVTLDATDNGGIRRVEILDVTDGGTATSSARRTTRPARAPSAARPARSACAKACPNLSNEIVRPTALPAGPRNLKVRVIDAGGNVTEQGPYTVDVATPSDRGPLNGSGATEDGKLSARFTHGCQDAPHRRLQLAGHASPGRLLNSAGRPISGAALRVLTRDRRQSARFVERYTTTTRSDGIYRVTVRAARLAPDPGRLALARRDPGFQESAYVTLNARASSSLSATPRSVGVGGRLRLSGTRARHDPARAASPLIFQGRAGNGRYTTFADGRANRRGRFSIRYRFRSGSSRGRTFTFRVKLRGDARFPYALGYSKRVPSACAERQVGCPTDQNREGDTG